MKQDYQSLKVSLRYFLIGRRYYTALRAMALGLQYHTGTRKDGVTPEFEHQVSQALYIQTVSENTPYEEHFIILALLHDLMEDYPVLPNEVRLALSNDSVSKEAVEAMVTDLKALNKAPGGLKLTTEEYYENLSEHPLSAIEKGADRMHNLSSAYGVLSNDKVRQYLEETVMYVLPLLKKIRRTYPEHTAMCENLKRVLSLQVTLMSSLVGYTHKQTQEVV